MNRFTNRHQLLHTAIRAGALIVASIALLWFRMPVVHEQDFDMGLAVPMPADKAANMMPESVESTVSESMFQMELWHTPVVAPPAKVEPVVRSTPLRVQLIAIIAEERSGHGAAVMYDPDRDELRSVRIGSEIGGLDVRDITHNAVELGRGSRSQRIELETLEIEL